jgi:hypothetical protein
MPCRFHPSKAAVEADVSIRRNVPIPTRPSGEFKAGWVPHLEIGNPIASLAMMLNYFQRGRIEERDMMEIRKRIAATALGVALAIGANHIASAQASMPVRKSPPPAAVPTSAQPAQPTSQAQSTEPTALTTTTVAITLTCGVAGINTSILSFMGAHCTAQPVLSGRTTYCATLTGLNGGMSNCPVAAYDQAIIRCMTASGNASAFYGGVAGKPGEITFAAKAPVQVCTLEVPLCQASLEAPQRTELIIHDGGTTTCP